MLSESLPYLFRVSEFYDVSNYEDRVFGITRHYLTISEIIIIRRMRGYAEKIESLESKKAQEDYADFEPLGTGKKENFWKF